jgi:hypothetical protein
MRPRTVIVALLPSFLLGIACAYLYGEVQRESARARAESELRSQLQGRVDQLDATRAQLERELTSLRLRSSDSGGVIAAPPVANADKKAPIAVGTLSAVEAPFAQPSESQLEWMRSPIARDLQRSHQRDWIRRSSDDLFALLDLSPEQTEVLIALMADAQSPPFELGAAGAIDPEALHKKLREHQRESEAAIRELLGDEKFRTYQEYQGSAMERMQVAELKRLFEATPTPLRAEQSDQLLAVFREERERAPTPTPWSDRSGPATAEEIQRYQQWAEEQQLRIRERVGALLTPEQLDRFMAYQQMQDAMRQEAMVPYAGAGGGIVLSTSGVAIAD